MKTLGIVAEYNPFHNGHKYHVETAKEKSGADVCIAIMSGNFSQRGLPCVEDKWTRARWALENGVDLVIELPVCYATSHAGDFAKGSIKMLEKMGVDYISFGAENDGEILREIADKDFDILSSKDSYAKQREEALGNAEILRKSNNILAIEYFKSIKNAKPLVIKRQGTGYLEKDIKGFPSATAVRQLAKEGKDYSKYVPEGVKVIPENLDKLWEMAVSKAIEMEAEDIDRINSSDEGFGNLIKKKVRMAGSYEELVEELKSKKYTRSRIQRFILQLVLGITKEDVKGKTIRVLGFNEKGSAFLKELKDRDVEYITKVGKEDIPLDVRANDIYNLLLGRDLYQNSDYVKKPVIITK
ncbi:MAG: nucleotidyltransferase family protein [Clostridia bacterium]|nr:nucleotidyltransferase family protein [Clostridia bacterium]